MSISKKLIIFLLLQVLALIGIELFAQNHCDKSTFLTIGAVTITNAVDVAMSGELTYTTKRWNFGGGVMFSSARPNPKSDPQITSQILEPQVVVMHRFPHDEYSVLVHTVAGTFSRRTASIRYTAYLNPTPRDVMTVGVGLGILRHSNRDILTANLVILGLL